MGWSGGASVMEAIVRANRKFGSVHGPALKGWYFSVIHALTDMDWDDIEECRGLDPYLDEAIDEYARAMGWNNED